MVHQHFMLIPKLTVTENIIVGQEIGTALKVDRKKAGETIGALSEQYGLKIDPNKKVADLSVTEQQRVEILKVLYREAEILISMSRRRCSHRRRSMNLRHPAEAEGKRKDHNLHQP